MYRVNNLKRNVLIVPDEVIYHTSISHTFDRLKIEQSIIIAEERWIKPALTPAFYNYLTSQKNKTVVIDNRVEMQALIFADTDNEENVISVGQIINAVEYMEPNNQKLWNEVLWKLVAECVYCLSIPQAYIQFQSAGIVMSNPPANPLSNGGIVSPDVAGVKWMMDRIMMDRIDPMLTALHNYLCDNRTVYPLYTKKCECDEPQKVPTKRTDFILGLYDNTDDCSCGVWDQFNTP